MSAVPAAVILVRSAHLALMYFIGMSGTLTSGAFSLPLALFCKFCKQESCLRRKAAISCDSLGTRAALN